MYQVELEQFNGPLDLLLKLIQDKELDISQISLAKIADQYLSYIESHEVEIDPDGLADFLWIGSRLIYIKSRLLVPKVEEEDEGDADDLEAQLKIYREFLDASKELGEIIKTEKFSYCRPRQEKVAGFYPPKNLNAKDLKNSFEKILQDLEPLNKLSKKRITRIVSLKQRISQVKDFIFRRAKVGFNSLVANKKDRHEVIVTFLAVLELNKSNSVALKQEGLFSEIKISKHK